MPLSLTAIWTQGQSCKDGSFQAEVIKILSAFLLITVEGIFESFVFNCRVMDQMCPSPDYYVTSLKPNVTKFGDRVSKEITNIK